MELADRDRVCSERDEDRQMLGKGDREAAGRGEGPLGAAGADDVVIVRPLASHGYAQLFQGRRIGDSRLITLLTASIPETRHRHSHFDLGDLSFFVSTVKESP